MPPDVRIHQVAFYKGRLKKCRKARKYHKKQLTIQNIMHTIAVEMNRNSSGQGAA